MAYADQQMSSNRIIAIVIVALIHLAIGYVLITGLALQAVNEVVERVTTVDVTEPPPPPPPDEPPPPPPDTPPAAPPPPVAQVPPINVSQRPPDIRTTTQIPPPAPPAVFIPPPAPPGPRPVPPPPPPPPPPPAPSQARSARADNQGSWARRIQDNYPSRALNEGTEGRVGISVTVTPQGRATGCQVTSSSGSSVLDSAACQGVERYGRFIPALNAAGTPIAGAFRTTIVYQIPE